MTMSRVADTDNPLQCTCCACCSNWIAGAGLRGWTP